MKIKAFVRSLALLCTATLLLGSCGGEGTGVGTGTTMESQTTVGGTETGDDTTEEPTSVEIELPASVDRLPALTVGALTEVTDGLGGKGLPNMEGEVGADVPIISEISEMTYPNETLAIAGHNLTGSSLIIWTEGSLKAVEPLRTDSTKIQATIPKDMTKSTTIVWPFNENGIGAPIRLNAPDIYWCDPAALYHGVAGQEIRFFGSGLFIEGHTPIVAVKYDNGTVETLEITDANPYQLKAKLKQDLSGVQTCTFYVHNGTGGAYGWSKAVTVAVEDNTILPADQLPVFKVDDYGAVADDHQDDLNAINAAIAAAFRAGGGVVEFGKGEYNISSTLIVSHQCPKGLYFKGAGKGDYDFASKLDPNEYEKRGISGDYTVLRFLDPAKMPRIFVQIMAPNVTFRDMTVIGGDNGHPHCFTFFVNGQNITFDSVRMIKADLRDFADSSSQLATGTNIEIDNYAKNITIVNCEFHQQASAINVGNIEGIWPWGYFDSERTVRNTRIMGCDFYGYAGPYTAPDGRKPSGDLGEISRALTGFNLEGLIFENNTVQGFDRDNDYVMVRSIYVGSACEKLYIANNKMTNVGNTPTTGFDLNTGEQILFHGNDFTGGIFNVTECDGKTVTVRTDNIRLFNDNGKLINPYETSTNAGSYVFSGLDKGDKGSLYIYSGKGVGQTRTVVGYQTLDDRIIFELEEPFTVDPDSTSIVDLLSHTEKNIIYKNTIANDKLIKADGLKTGGVLFFFQCGYNIVAENEMKNLSFGVSVNARFKGPCMWNTVRDNTLSGISEARRDAMQGGDSTYNAAFFCVSVVRNSPEGWDDYDAWYTVGNVFRNNTCRDGDVPVELTTNRWNRSNSEWHTYFGEEKGAAMSIVENNTFTDVATGVLIGNPDYWSLIRNNVFDYDSRPGYKKQACVFEQMQSNFYLLYMENDVVKSDANKTFAPNGGQSMPIALS